MCRNLLAHWLSQSKCSVSVDYLSVFLFPMWKSGPGVGKASLRLFKLSQSEDKLGVATRDLGGSGSAENFCRTSPPRETCTFRPSFPVTCLSSFLPQSKINCCLISFPYGPWCTTHLCPSTIIFHYTSSFHLSVSSEEWDRASFCVSLAVVQHLLHRR